MKNLISKFELNYALSYIFEKNAPDSVSKRLQYFSDLIENIVFSNELFTDFEINIDQEKTPKEKLYEQLFDSFNLKRTFKHVDTSTDLTDLSTIKNMRAKSHDLSLDDELVDLINLVNILNPVNIDFASSFDPDFLHFMLDLSQGESFFKNIDSELVQDSVELLTGRKSKVPEGHVEFLRNMNLREFVDFYINESSGTLSQFLASLVEFNFDAAGKNDLTFLPMNHLSSIVKNKPFLNYGHEITFKKLNNLMSEEEVALHDYYVKKYNFEYEFPLIFRYIASKANSKKELMDIALDLRESKEIIHFRNWCSQLDEALRNGNRKEAFEMNKECNEFIDNLQRKMNIDRKVSFRLSFLPAMMVDLRKRDFINNDYQFALLKNVYKSTASSDVLMDKLSKMK